MKVLLKQNIDRLGRMGEVVEVAGGYARNYLIPRGLAVGVTRGRMKEIEEQKKVLEVKAVHEREALETVADRIRSRPIKVKARCSATGKLFGSVTNRQLAEAIAELTGDEIDRHKIVTDERIRSVGAHHCTIKLHPDITLEVEFEVEGEGFVPEEPPPEVEEGEEAPDQPEPAANADETQPLEGGPSAGADEAPAPQPLEGGLSARPDEAGDTDPNSERE